MGLPKYTGPLAPVPSWLDPRAEVKDPPALRLKPYEFALYCVAGFVAAGVPLLLAFALAACKVKETGWGEEFRAFNLGGVKANRAWARAYKARTGRAAPFYRAHGNVGTGDAQTVIYRGYDSAADFFAEWLAQFMPRAPGPAHRYRAAAPLFWAGDARWFAAMVAAGYRGPKTKARPEQAIADQARITQDIREAWVQRALGVAVDGVWGPKSTAACAAFQRARGLPVTGVPDDATVAMLATLATPAP